MFMLIYANNKKYNIDMMYLNYFCLTR